MSEKQRVILAEYERNTRTRLDVREITKLILLRSAMLMAMCAAVGFGMSRLFTWLATGDTIAGFLALVSGLFTFAVFDQFGRGAAS